MHSAACGDGEELKDVDMLIRALMEHDGIFAEKKVLKQAAKTSSILNSIQKFNPIFEAVTWISHTVEAKKLSFSSPSHRK